MKRLFVIGLIAALISGCALFPKASARVNITGTSQSGDYAYVYFDITNTGNVEIDYYEVYFDIHCTNGEVITVWTNGLNLGRGDTYSDYTIDNIGSRTVSYAEVNRKVLTVY